jgi:hypothetical protein
LRRRDGSPLLLAVAILALPIGITGTKFSLKKTWRAPITIYGAFAFTLAGMWWIYANERKKEKLTDIITGGQGPAKAELNVKLALTYILTGWLAFPF